MKTPIIYIGHGLAGYYGIEKLMTGKMKNEIEIKAVITSNKDARNAEIVNKICQYYNLKKYSENLDDTLAEKLSSLNAELGVIMNFDQKIPKKIIETAKNGFWNIHQSDLPKYRGGYPLEFTIANDDYFKVSVHEITDNFDDGRIIHKSNPIRIWNMDFDELYFFSSKQSAIVLEDALKLFISKNYQPKAQDEKNANYANKKNLEKLLTIDWKNDSGDFIYRKILAGGKRRGAKSEIEINGTKKEFRITEGNFIAVLEKNDDEPGTLKIYEDDCYGVKAIDGTIYVSKIKSENPKEDSQIIDIFSRAGQGKVVLS
jgi:methionyl-tRNA formyltransferase